MKTLKHTIRTAVILSLLFSINFKATAHCEIPCGIYGDSLRIDLMYEHIETIEKSMSKIIELSGTEKIDYNQLIRWVNNKEEHANKLQEIVSQYFLHQRIKIKEETDTDAYNKYIEELTLLHKLLVYAMKSKQSTDIQYIEKMRETLHAFQHEYFE